MTFLAKGKKQDLLELAEALDVTVGGKFNVLKIRDGIANPDMGLWDRTILCRLCDEHATSFFSNQCCTNC